LTFLSIYSNFDLQYSEKITAIVVKSTMKKILHYIKDKWYAFARILGRVNTVILLTLIYILIIGPMALVAKLVKSDPLQRKKNPAKTSYWLNRAPNDPTIERHKYQF
jgi:hypothetical protein